MFWEIVCIVLYVLGAVVSYCTILDSWYRKPIGGQIDKEYRSIAVWTTCIWPLYALFLLLFIPSMLQAIRHRGQYKTTE